MNDTRRIKESYDLRRIVEQDLGQPSIRSGRASLYKCPFHNERKGYSLAVWHDGYRCFGKCDTAGDLFDWLMNYRCLSFPEALAALGENRNQVVKPETQPRVQSIATEPPSDDWQIAAREVVSTAEDTLWSSVGERALSYLLERGLSTTTIRKARLGFVPGDFCEWREITGLNVPCGITIPWSRRICRVRWTKRLLKLSPRFRELWLPDSDSKDITDFYLNGGDLYIWVEKGMKQPCRQNTLLAEPF